MEGRLNRRGLNSDIVFLQEKIRKLEANEKLLSTNNENLKELCQDYSEKFDESQATLQQLQSTKLFNINEPHSRWLLFFIKKYNNIL